MDDIFDDDGAVDATANITRGQYTQGYREGLNLNRNVNLQKGFDIAYPKGASIAIEIGQILARAKRLDADIYLQAKRELAISKFLDIKHFDAEYELNDDGKAILSKWNSLVA